MIPTHFIMRLRCLENYLLLYTREAVRASEAIITIIVRVILSTPQRTQKEQNLDMSNPVITKYRIYICLQAK